MTKSGRIQRELSKCVRVPTNDTHRSGYRVTLTNGDFLILDTGKEDAVDVWRSSDRGAHWACVCDSTGMKVHWSCSDACVLPNGDVIVIGLVHGDRGTMDDNNVWRSRDGGVHWEVICPITPWVMRYCASLVVLGNGTLVYAGGYINDYKGLNDVWSSTDGGVSWRKVCENAAWCPRFNHLLVATTDNNLVLMGGQCARKSMNQFDVWRSCDGGRTWHLVCPEADWMRYGYLDAVSLANGTIVLLCGDGGTWLSNDEGMTWSNVPHKGLPWGKGCHGLTTTTSRNTVLFENADAFWTWDAREYLGSL